MIKEVKAYRTSGSTVILSHNGSSWYVNLWGVFNGETHDFVNRRVKFGNRKWDALAFYTERERELVTREAFRALLGPPRAQP